MNTQSEPVPLVLLDLDYTDGAFELVLVNTGADPVFDVRVEFSHDLIGIGGSKVISDLPVWTGLSVLRAGKEIRIFFDSATNVFRSKRRRRFTATVTWRTLIGGKHDAVYKHDFDTYRDMPQITGRD